MSIGIGWNFDVGGTVHGMSLCNIIVRDRSKINRSSIGSIVWILYSSLEEAKMGEGDLRNFPVYDVIRGIRQHVGNEVEVDANIRYYGEKMFGTDVFDPNFVFIRKDDEYNPVFFEYGKDGTIEDLVSFLMGEDLQDDHEDVEFLT